MLFISTTESFYWLVKGQDMNCNSFIRKAKILSNAVGAMAITSAGINKTFDIGEITSKMALYSLPFISSILSNKTKKFFNDVELSIDNFPQWMIKNDEYTKRMDVTVFVEDEQERQRFEGFLNDKDHFSRLMAIQVLNLASFLAKDNTKFEKQVTGYLKESLAKETDTRNIRAVYRGLAMMESKDGIETLIDSVSEQNQNREVFLQALADVSEGRSAWWNIGVKSVGIDNPKKFEFLSKIIDNLMTEKTPLGEHKTKLYSQILNNSMSYMDVSSYPKEFVEKIEKIVNARRFPERVLKQSLFNQFIRFTG